MSTFGERFNAWRVEHGEEPVPPEVVEALDAAAADTARDLRDNQDQIVREIQEFMAGLVEGYRRAIPRLLVAAERAKGEQ